MTLLKPLYQLVLERIAVQFQRFSDAVNGSDVCVEELCGAASELYLLLVEVADTTEILHAIVEALTELELTNAYQAALKVECPLVQLHRYTKIVLECPSPASVAN